eukprot:s11912_g1.t1
MQTIHNWPTFDAKTGVMVQLSKFESAVAEYENLSNSTLGDDNKLAAVLRCLTGQLRTQATVLITETSTYQDLCGLIERWDTSQTRWSTSLASTYGISASSGGGPAPMEIDRVSKGKDKGKDKGKGKGKGKHQNQQYPQSGKGKGKGKQQNQQYPQSGKGNYKSTALCGWCQKPGHYKRECRAFQAYLRQNGQDSQGARQVQDASAASTSGSASIAASSMPSSAGQYQANAKAKVNLSVADVNISSAGAEEIDIVIDSGADESCLPSSLAWCGTSLGSTNPDFADAQGNLLDIEDHKTVLLELPNAAGDLQCFRESCLVSSVSSPLFAVGKLYQLGWSCFWEDNRFYLGRQGDPETYIPIFFKHNSLYA